MQDPKTVARIFGVTVGTARRWRRNNDLPVKRWVDLSQLGVGERVQTKAVSRVKTTKRSNVREAVVEVSGSKGPLDLIQIGELTSAISSARLPRQAPTYQYVIIGEGVVSRDEYVKGVYQATIISTGMQGGKKVDRWQFMIPSPAFRTKARAIEALTQALQELDPLFIVKEIMVRSITPHVS